MESIDSQSYCGQSIYCLYVCMYVCMYVRALRRGSFEFYNLTLYSHRLNVNVAFICCQVLKLIDHSFLDALLDISILRISQRKQHERRSLRIISSHNRMSQYVYGLHHLQTSYVVSYGPCTAQLKLAQHLIHTHTVTHTYIHTDFFNKQKFQ